MGPIHQLPALGIAGRGRGGGGGVVVPSLGPDDDGAAATKKTASAGPSNISASAFAAGEAVVRGGAIVGEGRRRRCSLDSPLFSRWSRAGSRRWSVAGSGEIGAGGGEGGAPPPQSDRPKGGSVESAADDGGGGSSVVSGGTGAVERPRRASVASCCSSSASISLRSLLGNSVERRASDGGLAGSALSGLSRSIARTFRRNSVDASGWGGGGGGSGGGGGGSAADDAGARAYLLGKEAADAGNWSEALEHYHESLSERQLQSKRQDDASPSSVPLSLEIARTLFATGIALSELNEPYAAITSLEESLSMREAILGPGHQDVAETVSRLTVLLDDVRKDSGMKGRKLIRGSHDSCGELDRLFGGGCCGGAEVGGEANGHESLSTLGASWCDVGLGSRPQSGLTTIMDLEAALDEGMSLLEQARYEEAEEVLSRCLEAVGTDEEVSKSSPPGPPGEGNMICDACDRRGSNASISFSASSGASASSATQSRALTAMACLERARGRYSDARRLSRQALELARSDASSVADRADEEAVNVHLAECIASHAEALREGRTDLAKAHELHCEALNIREASADAARERKRHLDNRRRFRQRGRHSNDGICGAGVDDNDDDDGGWLSAILDVASSHTQLGATLSALGRHEEAYGRHRKALATRFRFLDFVDALVSESLNYSAESLVRLRRPGEALCFALHSVEIRKLEFGTKHPSFAHSLGVLAGAYHEAGRSRDALPLWERCLRICTEAFSPMHASLIPNLVGYGDVLAAVGDVDGALVAYQRTVGIHEANFGSDARNEQISDVLEKVESLKAGERHESETSQAGIESRSSHGGPSRTGVRIPVLQNASRGGGANPIIIVTDVGKDIDDELALCLLAALRAQKLLDPLAVVTTRSPSADRAQLARGTLDSLGLHDVPVGIGSDGRGTSSSAAAESEGSPPPEDECYGGAFRAPLPLRPPPTEGFGGIAEDGLELMAEALTSAPPKSVRILCIASLTDVASLLREHQRLFIDRVKEVVVMGGASWVQRRGKNFLEPDSAYNNHCDVDAAKYVYRTCQESAIPTVTLTRWAAYSVAFSNTLLDEFRRTEHMVASNVRNVNLSSINKLWSRVNLPVDDPRRGKLPGRCDRRWFCEKFLDNPDAPIDGAASIWSEDMKFFMYDPLALLCCVPALRKRHFEGKQWDVNGTGHVVVGLSEAETGVVDKEALFVEVSSSLLLAFEDAMQQICVAPLA